MQQLSFFSFDNESEENKKSTKKSKVNVSVNKKIIDIKTKDYKVNSKVKAPKFDFESTLNRVNELRKISLKNSWKELYFFKSDLEIGRLLTDLFSHNPYIYKGAEKVTFWDYLEIEAGESYGYMRSFHIYNLLKINGFKSLPNDREHTDLIEDYTDSQIIEIWEHLTSDYKKVTEKNIIQTIKSLEKTKELENIESSDINYSYAKLMSNHYEKTLFDLYLSSNAERDKLKSKINELEQHNSLLNSLLFRLQGNNKFNENNNKEKDYTDFYLKVLNLKSDYTQKDLKDSYNNHIKIYHPDKNIDEDDNRKISFENNFKLVKEAHDYLKK